MQPKKTNEKWMIDLFYLIVVYMGILGDKSTQFQVVISRIKIGKCIDPIQVIKDFDKVEYKSVTENWIV